MIKRHARNLLKLVALLVAGFMAAVMLVVIFLAIALGVFDRTYDHGDMATHYEAQQDEFALGATELRNILAPHKVSIELDGNQVEILHTSINGEYASNWPHGDRQISDSILHRLDISPQEFGRIETILADLDCIGFSNFREEDNFSFQRSGMGMYSYLIFPTPLPDSSLAQYRQSCSHSIHTPRVIFEYGGGAISSDCLGETFDRQ